VTRLDAPPTVAWWRVAVIGAAALAVALGLLDALRLLARPLALLFLGIVIAETLAPVVARLERVVARGIAVGIV
jgi:predicted PurR-regulated permease PerM